MKVSKEKFIYVKPKNYDFWNYDVNPITGFKAIDKLSFGYDMNKYYSTTYLAPKLSTKIITLCLLLLMD